MLAEGTLSKDLAGEFYFNCKKPGKMDALELQGNAQRFCRIIN